jgi:hypothetical protein
LLELTGYQSDEADFSPNPNLAPSLQRMLYALADQPAYILGRRWDVLCWNRAAEVVFGDYARLEGDERNCIYMLFANSDHRRLLIDWNDLAPVALGMFRAENAGHSGDRDYARLVDALLVRSPEFRHFWQRHEVSAYTPINKRVFHPSGGPHGVRIQQFYRR